MDTHHSNPQASRRELNTRIQLAMASHYQLCGNRDWHLIREHADYAPVIGRVAGEAGRRKFFRWKKVISQPLEIDTTRPHEGREAADAAMASATQRALEASRYLPAAPSPAYFLREGADADKNIDLMAHMHLILADFLRLRGEALTADETSPDGLKISDPRSFERSAKGRLDMVNAWLRIMQEIWDLTQQQEFQRAVVAVFEEDLVDLPEVQVRVLARFQALNDSQGMNPFGRMS